MNARLTLAVTAITVTLAAAGCGGGTSNSGDPGNQGTNNSANNNGNNQANKGPSCALAPASLVNATLGVSMNNPTETVNSVVTVCNYAPGSGSGGVTVRFQTNEDAAGFEVGKSGFTDSDQPVTDIPGFFDQAFSSTLGRGEIVVNTVVARQGSVEILVTSHATIDKEKELVTKLFGALG
jgi:hypothetical protein